MTEFAHHDHEDDDAFFNGRTVKWNVVALIVSVVVSIFATYNVTVNSYDRRISVLESRQVDTDRRLERIESKIDDLLRMAR